MELDQTFLRAELSAKTRAALRPSRHNHDIEAVLDWFNSEDLAALCRAISDDITCNHVESVVLAATSRGISQGIDYLIFPWFRIVSQKLTKRLGRAGSPKVSDKRAPIYHSEQAAKVTKYDLFMDRLCLCVHVCAHRGRTAVLSVKFCEWVAV
jgi:hypothetical protein